VDGGGVWKRLPRFLTRMGLKSAAFIGVRIVLNGFKREIDGMQFAEDWVASAMSAHFGGFLRILSVWRAMIECVSQLGFS
jgi:hypothetical protein